MEKKSPEDLLIEIEHKIIKDKLGITDNPGIVSEDNMDEDWFELDINYLVDKGDAPDE
jgi:hypothetical protein